MPDDKGQNKEKVQYVMSMLPDNVTIATFNCEPHKAATYAQCSRLYAAALDFHPSEVLVTSDIDMAVFNLPPIDWGMTIFGSDLTPQGQYPICYAIDTAAGWKHSMNIGDKTIQECLDELLGHINVDNMRGNYWGKDQETLHYHTHKTAKLYKRAKPGTQFATHRIDRDDAYWEERLNWDVFDAHLWRPFHATENAEKIIKLFSYFYPYDNLTWIKEYAEKYRSLI
jgi:hypothetical protein